MTIKLDDLLKQKNPGDEWYSIQAPEELRFWNKEFPWEEFYQEYGVCFYSASVKTSIDKEKHENKYNTKTPLLLKETKIEKGTIVSFQKTSAYFDVKAESTKEFNLKMQGLSDLIECDMWDVKKIIILSDNKKIEFKHHNPDGNGPNLYLYSVCEGSHRVLYPDILYSTQEKLCKNFREKIAHCTAAENTEMVHGCAIKAGIKKKQIKTKKKE